MHVFFLYGPFNLTLKPKVNWFFFFRKRIIVFKFKEDCTSRCKTRKLINFQQMWKVHFLLQKNQIFLKIVVSVLQFSRPKLFIQFWHVQHFSAFPSLSGWSSNYVILVVQDFLLTTFNRCILFVVHQDTL